MRKKNGFTLTELLVTVAMLAVVGTVIIISAIGINNSSKETQYKRMVENIINSAKTYASLYPDDFNKLYSSVAFEYVPLKNIIAAGLLDEEIINPYTKEQIDLDQNCSASTITGDKVCLSQLKVYIDGDTLEMTYKYPLTHDDFNTVIWLRTSSIVSSATDSGFEPVFAYSGIVAGANANNDFAFSDEDGNLISATVGESLLAKYKNDFHLEYEMPSSFVSCATEGNLTETQKEICNGMTTETIPLGASKADYYFPTQTGDFEIKYKWNYTHGGDTIYRNDYRIVRVMSATEEEKEKEKTNVKTTTTKVTTPDEDGIIYHLSNQVIFNQNKPIETGIPILQTDSESTYPHEFTIEITATTEEGIRNSDILLDCSDSNSNGFIIYHSYGHKVLKTFKGGALWGSTKQTELLYNGRPFKLVLTYGGEGESKNSMDYYYSVNPSKNQYKKVGSISLGSFSDAECVLGGYRNGTSLYTGKFIDVVMYNKNKHAEYDALLS